MVDTDKVRENRLRRMASRQGLNLVKSRRRDPRATDYAKYWLYDPDGKAWELYQLGERHEAEVGGRHGLTLDEVEKHLTE